MGRRSDDDVSAQHAVKEDSADALMCRICLESDTGTGYMHRSGREIPETKALSTTAAQRGLPRAA